MNYLYFYLYIALLSNCGRPQKLSVPKCPTFFVCGKWMGPWHTKKWKQRLIERKECEYKQYTNAKHWVMNSQCDKFNKDVEKWLAQNL